MHRYRLRDCRRALGHAGDADRFFALGDLDLGETRLLEQLDELLDLTDVHSYPLAG
jgi:hypothetical protein